MKPARTKYLVENVIWLGGAVIAGVGIAWISEAYEIDRPTVQYAMLALLITLLLVSVPIAHGFYRSFAEELRQDRDQDDEEHAEK